MPHAPRKRPSFGICISSLLRHWAFGPSSFIANRLVLTLRCIAASILANRRCKYTAIASLWIGFCLLAVSPVVADEPAVRSTLTWDQLEPLPDPIGFAGMFAGVSHDVLIAAGGANFPDGPPWEGGSKVWYDTVYVLPQPDAKWQLAEQRLPRSIAYGVSVTYKDTLICIGGDDGKQSRAEVFQLEWDMGQLKTTELPALPQPCTQMCGALVGNTIYIAGGQDRLDAVRALDTFWALDLEQPAGQRAWKALPAWPGPERIQAVPASFEGGFYLFGGLQLKQDDDGKPGRVTPYLSDAYRYAPGSDGQEKNWQRLAEMPRPIAAAPSPAMKAGDSHLLLFGGVDGSLMGSDPVRHPGFLGDISAYHPLTDRWSPQGKLPPEASRVTAPLVHYGGGAVVVSGESRPAVRSPACYRARFQMSSHAFGALNWSVLGVYMLALVGMGFYFSTREKSTDDFFLAGRRIPWWAAGLSIFATMLSAITYLSIPARSYGTNWTYYLMNLGILGIAPIVIYLYLPFFRRLNVTTAYEYLEKRFSLSVRLLGSASFVAFQLARMGIVVLLPALALSAVTGMNVYVCIAIMGVLSTLYTVLGGIEAVIWTDVIQVFVLIGGAIATLTIIAVNLDGGLMQIFEVASAEKKFQLVNLSWDWTTDSLGVILLGAIFANLVPYTTDQAVIQRYLTTRDERQAAAAIWTNGLLCVPASALFFLVGTALFVFFRAFPVELAPLEKADQIFPWFIAQQMPAGLAGLVIAGVFAAAMSSLDSSIHSISTAITTDFVRRFRPEKSEHELLNIARILTVVLGFLGTATAMLMVGVEIKFLWDFFIGIVGLLGGTLCGLFMLGIFTRSTTSRHVWIGAVASAAALVYARYFTDLNGLLYAAIGTVSCFAVGVIASMAMPNSQKDISGLTIFDRRGAGDVTAT